MHLVNHYRLIMCSPSNTFFFSHFRFWHAIHCQDAEVQYHWMCCIFLLDRTFNMWSYQHIWLYPHGDPCHVSPLFWFGTRACQTRYTVPQLLCMLVLNYFNAKLKSPKRGNSLGAYCHMHGIPCCAQSWWYMDMGKIRTRSIVKPTDHYVHLQPEPMAMTALIH